uniref:Uncharacterized protein n=1 Tax=Rhizophora mucronata TaxID=61149 RepID=A0A2P2Q1X6_RHIMU
MASSKKFICWRSRRK